MDYSVVIPIYKEFETIRLLYSRLREIMDPLNKTYEIIFVYDGAVTPQMKQIESSLDNRIVKIMYLPHHMGQTRALAAGFASTQGNVVISMDGDLQDDPRYIPDFVQKLSQGYDVVCGYRIVRHDQKIKIFLSRLGNFFQQILLRVPIHDICCTYRIYTKKAAQSLCLNRKGLHRYIPFLLYRQGYTIGEIAIVQNKRLFGRSHYNVGKVFDIIKGYFLLRFNCPKKPIK